MITTPPIKRPRYRISDLSHWTQEMLVAEARHWSDQFSEGELGFHLPEQATWSVDNYYPISLIVPDKAEQQQWIDFIDAEIKMWAEEGQPRRFNDMKDGKIRDHIVVLVRDGKHYVWDGNHRLSSAIKAGATTIPVIIGHPFPAPDLHPSTPTTKSLDI